MKRLVPAVFLLTLVLVFSAGAQPAEQRSISVSGDAEIRVVPDEVIVILGVETFAEVLTEAKKSNDDRTRDILAAANDFDVPPQHVETDFISVQPEYRDDRIHQKLVGYTVRRTIQITLREIDAFESLLTAALDAGANYVHGIQFRTTELRKFRDQARKLAVEAAREKAAAIAEHMGLRLGAPVMVTEGYSHWASGYGSWWGGGRYGNVSQNVVQMGGGAGATGPTSPGQISVSAQVSVRYELLD